MDVSLHRIVYCDGNLTYYLLLNLDDQSLLLLAEASDGAKLSVAGHDNIWPGLTQPPGTLQTSLLRAESDCSPGLGLDHGLDLLLLLLAQRMFVVL